MQTLLRKITYLTIGLLCGLTYIAQAQNDFSLTGEVRPRTEFRNGFKKLTTDQTDAALFTEQRSRLYFDYKNENIKFKLALQDVRVWGQTGQIFKDDPGMSTISEAWGEAKLSKLFSVKVGRQIISYDNQRFLGGLEWAQQGRRHDAAIFKLNADSSGVQLHAGLAFNQNVLEPKALVGTLYTGVANYKTMQYLWFHKDLTDGGLSLLAFNAGIQQGVDSVNFKQTLGGVFNKGFGNVKIGAEAYYQMGAVSKTVDAQGIFLGLSATFKTSVTPITVGVEYLSGDDSSTSDKNEAFSPDFGTNHKFNGFMDYFYVGNPHGNVGLINPYLKTKFKLSDKSALLVHYHNFMAQQDVPPLDGKEVSKALGNEVDLVYNLNAAKGINLKLGYSHMFATDAMQSLKGGDKGVLNNWAWAMLTIKPQLFKASW